MSSLGSGGSGLLTPVAPSPSAGGAHGKPLSKTRLFVVVHKVRAAGR
jgi:hypothetical protein